MGGRRLAVGQGAVEEAWEGLLLQLCHGRVTVRHCCLRSQRFHFCFATFHVPLSPFVSVSSVLSLSRPLSLSSPFSLSLALSLSLSLPLSLFPLSLSLSLSHTLTLSRVFLCLCLRLSLSLLLLSHTLTLSHTLLPVENPSSPSHHGRQKGASKTQGGNTHLPWLLLSS